MLYALDNIYNKYNVVAHLYCPAFRRRLAFQKNISYPTHTRGLIDHGKDRRQDSSRKWM